ncbi:MAG: hypothetical protein KAR32_05155, partial [Candidatus Omnitrophica bacterium]|nr:hypothetical protein [Candidatus Omnitrophota bacterium]
VDPTKGNPNNPVWRKFYEKKLDPLTPRHEVYLPQFVQNFMDPDRGDWQEFRKTVEADKGSPWRVVLVEVEKIESERKIVEAPKSVYESRSTEKKQPVIDTSKLPWQGIRMVPSIIRAWTGYIEVPVGIKTGIKNFKRNIIEDFRVLSGAFMDFVREFLSDFFMWLHSIRQWIDNVLHAIKEILVPVWYVPGLTAEFLGEIEGRPLSLGIEKRLSTFKRGLSPIKSGAVVAASSSPVSMNSLTDPTWLAYFEQKPEKASSPIEAALRQGDVDALATIRAHKDEYPQLNTLIDQLEEQTRTVLASKAEAAIHP